MFKCTSPCLSALFHATCCMHVFVDAHVLVRNADDVGGQSITQIGSVRFVSADGSKEWRKAWGVRRNVQAAVSGAPPAAAASVGGGGDGSGGGSSGGRGRRSKLGRASPSSASDAIDLDSMADDETR